MVSIVGVAIMEVLICFSNTSWQIRCVGTLPFLPRVLITLIFALKMVAILIRVLLLLLKKVFRVGPDDDNDGKVKQMNSPLNTYILRLADVYLTYAEACLGNNSTLSDGRGLYFFNRVRERAKINKKSSITLDDIIRERRVEFGMEYSNWYDMVTWFRYLPDKMLNYFNNQWRGTGRMLSSKMRTENCILGSMIRMELRSLKVLSITQLRSLLSILKQEDILLALSGI